MLTRTVDFVNRLQKLKKKMTLKKYNEELSGLLKMKLDNKWNVDYIFAQDPHTITIELKV